ncbi:hypothetical protein K2Y00_03640 [Patescibacteria group bacterium]|nr:hypothetical protein [Patescibacteria group bacterium]
MKTSHLSVAGLVFLAVVAIVQFSPTQLAMAQCGGAGSFSGFSGPSYIVIDGIMGDVYYSGNMGGGVEWDPVFHAMFGDTVNQLPSKDFFSFLFPENIFAQCGNINPPPSSPSVSLTATPGSINSGGNSVLTWSGQNVVSCTGTGFSTGGNTSGSVNVSPDDTTTYSITCSTTGGGSGNWELSDSYTTDYSCPLSSDRVDRPHRHVPDCPTGSPEGNACSPGGTSCKVNYASGCNVISDIYSCEADGGVGQTVSDTATVTVSACTPSYNSSRWYTGGTEVAVSSLEMGNSAADCRTITPGNIEYTSWNRQVQYQDGGVATYDPVRTMCWYYNGATGTESKPGQSQGDWYFHYDSGSTCTVPAVPQCSNGADDDGDGYVDYTEDGGCEDGLDDDEIGDTLPQCSDGQDNNSAGGSDYPNDPSCTSADDDSEDGVTAGVSCSVDSSSVSVGGTTTYRATANNGASAPFTWTPSGQTLCTGGANNTCTFPGTGPYTMSVRAQGATSPASCPIVTAGCAGPTEVSITANGEGDDVRVKDGAAALIEWEVTTAAASCTVTENGALLTTLTPNACNATGQMSRTISTQTTYLLTCGSETDLVIVNVDTSLLEF